MQNELEFFVDKKISREELRNELDKQVEAITGDIVKEIVREMRMPKIRSFLKKALDVLKRTD